jgi:hypothetical protein
MIRRLIEAAQSSLKDAKLKSLSNEGRFDLAYKAIMQSANAALQLLKLVRTCLTRT